MLFRSRNAALLLVVLTGVGAALHVTRAPSHYHAEIVAAAEAFIATLDAEGRGLAVRPLEDQERFNWNFVPTTRSGLPLKQMTLEQRTAGLTLLQSALGSQGYLKATGVMQLEAILGVMESRPERRDPEDYYFWVFGSPSLSAPWAWRFEGHHLSISFTSADGVTVTGPAFMGANPARVPSGPHAGWRLLGGEEDMARALVRSLDGERRAAAVIAAEAPSDIVTGTDRAPSLPLEGITVGAMTADQRALFMRLLAEYVDNVEPGMSAERHRRLEAAGIDQLRFAWAGSVEPGQPHYYRIQGPTLLIEYDNTQNDANHIHSVFRDLENDFGADLLRSHYETAGADHGHDHGPETHVHGGG